MFERLRVLIQERVKREGKRRWGRGGVPLAVVQEGDDEGGRDMNWVWEMESEGPTSAPNQRSHSFLLNPSSHRCFRFLP